jgi:hypothetical protein
VSGRSRCADALVAERGCEFTGFEGKPVVRKSLSRSVEIPRGQTNAGLKT